MLPDPLGGLQSGYARQYNQADAFTVYLGGHLISHLKFSVAESKQILTDLHDWLHQNGFLFETDRSFLNPDIQDIVRAYQIFIQAQDSPAGSCFGFLYAIRGIIKTAPLKYKGRCANQQYYIETIIPKETADQRLHLWPLAKLLNISAVHANFITLLDL